MFCDLIFQLQRLKSRLKGLWPKVHADKWAPGGLTLDFQSAKADCKL